MQAFLLRLGFVVILIGIVAGMYSQTTQEKQLFGLYTTNVTTKPYQSAQVPLIVGGALLMFTGFIFPKKKGE